MRRCRRHCAEPNPNAIIRLQRVRDIPTSMARLRRHARSRRAVTASARTSTTTGPTRCTTPARRRLRDATRNAPTRHRARRRHALRRARRQQPAPVAGWQLADRRRRTAPTPRTTTATSSTSRTAATRIAAPPAAETGEYGFEDNVNPADRRGTPNGDCSTPARMSNGNGVLDDLRTRAQRPCRRRPTPASRSPLALAPRRSRVLTDVDAGVASDGGCTGVPRVKPLMARANRPLFFRRALKIVNGGLGQ